MVNNILEIFENADEHECVDCGSSKCVSQYGIPVEWRSDLFHMVYLCEDCWVIVYGEGKEFN